jgi:hypothetical protein
MNTALSISAVLVTLFGPFALALSGPPQTGQPMLVIVPPWKDLSSVVSAAGGQQIGPLPAMIAYSVSPNFPARLHHHGAWAVRDASRLASFCKG